MFMRRHLIFLLILVCCPVVMAAGNAVTDSLMGELEKVLSHRNIYERKKENSIREARQRLRSARDDRDRFDALGDLFGEYHPYNADSAYNISLRQEQLARKIDDRALIINAQLHRANILCSTGMYMETLDLTDSIDVRVVPGYLRPYYFHTLRTVYGRLADHAAFEPERYRYEALTDRYRDSLLSVNDPDGLFHALIKADQLNFRGQPEEAIRHLRAYVSRHDLSEHDKAICAWTFSEAYAKTGDRENQKKELLTSAIADMKSGVREYASLRELALLLYEEGDMDRAYRFLTIALDDAAKCNARHRIIELSNYYPTINGIYVETVKSQKKILELTAIIISALLVVVVLLLVLMWRQMKKKARARRQLKEANDRLNEVNIELRQTNGKLNHVNSRLKDSNEQLNEVNNRLQESNDRLAQANSEIAENSELKEVYIGRYMDQCLEYIGKLDTYRKTAAKLLASGKSDELKKHLKSSQLVDEELKNFYDRFDETFLNLFPTFVEDLNALLQEGEEIQPKKEGTLTPELRVYALIRLGVTDSDKIAKFLHYSISTIYNYRTKVRNKAKGDRTLLEAEVQKIAHNR